MRLALQSFSTLVQNMAASVQGGAGQPLDLSVGSTTRALLESNASVALWMQWLILLVLQNTRASTSSGADLDSWMADMTLVRFPAASATGLVTFSRYTPTSVARIAPGVLVRTSDGSQVFSVEADATNPAWDPANLCFFISAGVTSVTVPVMAQVPGAAGNVKPGTVTLIASATPGVDLVTNQAAFEGGADPEDDDALRARFSNFVQTRSQATVAAVRYAVSGVQRGLNSVVQENTDTSGAYRPGNFVVTVDDGSGSPSAALLSTIFSAVDAVRPIGSTFAVRPPGLITANVSCSIVAGSQKSLVTGSVANAISSYVNSLPIGASLPVSRIAQIAYDSSTLITNVGSILVNGLGADLVPPATSVVKAGAVVIS